MSTVAHFLELTTSSRIGVRVSVRFQLVFGNPNPRIMVRVSICYDVIVLVIEKAAVCGGRLKS